MRSTRLLALVVALLVLAACGGEDDASEEPDTATEDAEEVDDADDSDDDAEEPGDVARIEVDAPETVEIDESFTIEMRAFDEADNPVGGVRLTAESEPPITNLPDHDNFLTDDSGALSLTGLRAHRDEPYEVTLTLGGVSETLEFTPEE